MKIMSFIICSLFTLLSLSGCRDFVSEFYEVKAIETMKSDANLNRDMNEKQVDMHILPKSDMHILPKSDMHILPKSDMHMLPTADMHMLPTADMHMLPTADMQMIATDMRIVAMDMNMIQDHMLLHDLELVNNQDSHVIDMGGQSDQGYVINAPCGVNCPDMEMILIRAGSFNMGSDMNRNEQPIHPVQINRDFYVGKTEVTVGQYRTCVSANVCTRPNDSFFNIYCNWTNNVTDKEAHPLNCVDWSQARIFAKWVGGDLLTEAQWEYVARAEGQDITYPWGSMAPTCQFANFYHAGYCVNPPGTLPTCNIINGNTRQGVCDMAGNVSEWILDEWHDSYTNAPSDESAWCSDRLCEHNVQYRVYRGGSWFYDLSFLRTRFRTKLAIFSRDVDLGFRIAYPIH